MAKRNGRTGDTTRPGAGGETHQIATSDETTLTTNQGLAISDNQNTLKYGARGPALLEDQVMREKITHFDHERIPERIVHARGSGAHGYFQVYKSLAPVTRAAFLQDPSEKTRVFVRFSTVAGGAGSIDTPRDVRGFAVKFYTSEGNFDLVGNNIPVFFIQDAMKFPDLVHSVKMEPDRGFPQAASAHDTFWDFASLMPETMHMLMWTMSDRAIPRSYRMMEGFGVHTFRLINAKGKSSFVKFHWRPVAGSVSLVWDEAVKLGGQDFDFHRRDLWDAIARGDYPEYELALQVFDEDTANALPFDVLDATKLIPEEIVPLQIVGKMTLDRNPDNFFAETEQVAFHPGHVVPGIDFSNDPLLQGRLFSYTDTQISRLGGANFHEIPINQPVCPFRNFQRDGMRRMQVPTGRVAYEPNSLDPKGPRENPAAGFVSHQAMEEGPKLRQRPDSFADHYSQARLFWISMSDPERDHIAGAFTFELGKVETPAIRERMLGHLVLIHPELGNRVADGLGMTPDKIEPAQAPQDLPESPTLSLIRKAKPTLAGRKLGILATDGADAGLIAELRKAAEARGMAVALVAPKIGGIVDSARKKQAADMALASSPSTLFDAVAIVPSAAEAAALAKQAAVQDWVRDAFAHLKWIAVAPDGEALIAASGIEPDEGVVTLGSAKAAKAFFDGAARHRLWAREPKLRDANV